MRKRIFIYMAIIFIIGSVKAQTSLDLSFNTTGYNLISSGTTARIFFEHIKVLDDNRVVTAGFRFEGINNISIIVCRFNANGNLDNTFANTGVLGIQLGTDFQISAANCLEIQSDGKILVGAYYSISSTIDKFAIIRLNSDGTLDNSFGVNGIAKFNLSDYHDYVYGIKQLIDNKIIICGSSDINGFIIKLNSNGTFDNAFGDNGKKVFLIGAKCNFKNITIKADNKLIMIFNSKTDINLTNYDINGIVQFNADGTFDNSFGNSGKLIIQNHIIKDYIVDSQAILMMTINDNKSKIVRTNSLGVLDLSFGISGIVTSVDNFDFRSIQLQNDGKILLCGNAYTDNGSPMTGIVRYNSNGTLDNSFGTDGIYKNLFFYGTTSYLWCYYQKAVFKNNKIIFTGYVNNTNNHIETGIVARYQIQDPSTLTLSTNLLNIAAPTNSTKTFDITSNIGWTAASNQTWLTLSSASGSGNATITLTATANPTTATRTATVTVSGTGVTTQSITVTQDAGTTGITDITEKDYEIYPNPTSGLIKISIKNKFDSDFTVTIYDNIGRLLQTLDKNKSVVDFDIDLSKYPAGFYIISIHTNNRYYQSKVIRR